MDKINFQNLPSTTTPVNATNLNLLQTNVETAVNGIVESGGNANGAYIKYADGTLICYRHVTFNTTIASAWGSFYESPQLSIGSFPYEFIAAPPYVSGTCISVRSAYIENITDTTASAWGNLYLTRPNSNTSATDYKFCFLAIGRWKA